MVRREGKERKKGEVRGKRQGGRGGEEGKERAKVTTERAGRGGACAGHYDNDRLTTGEENCKVQ